MAHSLEQASLRPKLSAEDLPQFSEIEILGMDRPQYGLYVRGEPFAVSRGAYLFGTIGRTEKERAIDFVLARHGLNSRPYDPEHNPQGVVLAEHVRTESGQKNYAESLALRLLFVRADLLRALVSSTAATGNKAFSPPALAALEKASYERATYAFSHLQEFPRIADALTRIKASGGPEWQDIFREGSIPPLYPWLYKTKRNPIPLETGLLMIADALSGTKTKAEIAQAHKVTPETVSNFLIRNGSTLSLTDTMADLIDAKIKK